MKIRLSFVLMALAIAAPSLLQETIAQNTSPYWSLAGNSDATTASKLGTTNSVPLKFYANNSLRMIIQPTGNVGIGTSNPSYKLHVTIGSGTAVYGNGTTGVSGNGTSYGVYGNGITGVRGNGDTGVSGNGTSYGVYGNSTGVSGNGINYGVYGNGTGAPGNGVGYGVYGNGTDIGVFGNGSYTGVYGEGDLYGLYGYSGLEGEGVRGNAPNGTGVYGRSDNGIGLYGYGAVALYTYSTYAGVQAHGDKYGVLASGGNYGVIGYSSDSNSYAGYFSGNVYANETYTGSDRKLKQNIDDVANAMDIILKLQPKIYDFRHDGNFKLMNLPAGRHYGLIAQDVETILPGIVKDTKFDTKMANPEPNLPAGSKNTNQGVSAAARPVHDTKPSEIIDFKALNYTEMIPLLIKGMQEQQGQIEKLISKNNELQSQLDDLKSITRQGGNTTGNSLPGYIKQNVPNPANNATIISYFVPENTGRAQINITDMKGSLLKSYTAVKGQGQISIKTGELPAGTYNYSLYVNEQRIDSKQMVITK